MRSETSSDIHLSCETRNQRAGAATLCTLCIAVLIAQVDTSVVNLAAHAIGDHFDANVDALQWVIDSYNLVYAVLLLTGGLLADLYGRRLIFIAGAATFTVASIVCALAPSMPLLIAGRAFSGAGAALILPASLAIIRVAWPDHRARAKALGLWAACNGLALAIGPTLGGVLVNHYGWRSIFLAVTALGIAALALAPATIQESSDPQRRSFDAPAQILGALTLGGLAIAAIEARDAPLFAVAALAVSAISLVLFIRIEIARGGEALVPLDLFRAREFSGAIAATAGMTFGMYGALFLLPLSWQDAGSFDAFSAGVALMPMAIIFVLVSPFSGGMSARLGVRFMTAGGVAIIGCGLLLIGATAHASSIIGAEIGLGMTGLGMGLATGPLMGAAVGAAPAARSGTAAALINVARMAGATIGVAALGALYAIAQHGGANGLLVAMLAGGCVQLAAAATAWAAMRPS